MKLEWLSDIESTQVKLKQYPALIGFFLVLLAITLHSVEFQ